MKELYRLSSQPQSRVFIESMWAIERPNHGDAGVVNEKMLKEHYSISCMFQTYDRHPLKLNVLLQSLVYNIPPLSAHLSNLTSSRRVNELT